MKLNKVKAVGKRGEWSLAGGAREGGSQDRQAEVVVKRENRPV
jgi:hypothetical protein